MKITAVICARNELSYLRHVIPYLEREGIDVILIDNESTDRTLDFIKSHEFKNSVLTEICQYTGCFDLSRQLEIKSKVIDSLDSDWIIHQDADEFLHAPNGWGGLRDHIERADRLGFNAMNFNELVMLPANPFKDQILTNNVNYYFFEPRPLRLMRAWKRSAGLSNHGYGGHILSGDDVNVYPERMILKHFVVRCQEHAFEKYLHRTFASTDLDKGWHNNRTNFTVDNLQIPIHDDRLHRLASPLDAPARLPRPINKHFWEWPLQADIR